jgi:hypothetical protein
VKWPTSMMSSLLWGSRLWRELGVDWRHRRVSPPGDDLHRRLYLRQQVAQYRKLGRVGAHVAHRLDHPVAFVGRQVILADGVGQRVLLDAGERAGHDLPRVSATEAVEVGGFDPVLQPRSQLERDRRAAAADDQAAQPRPHRLEGEQAFRPRAQQQGVIVAVLALREADRQPVDDPELHLDGRVQPGGHDAASLPSSCRQDRTRIRQRTVPLASRGLAALLGRRLAGANAAWRCPVRRARPGRAGCAS